MEILRGSWPKDFARMVLLHYHVWLWYFFPFGTWQFWARTWQNHDKQVALQVEVLFDEILKLLGPGPDDSISLTKSVQDVFCAFQLQAATARHIFWTRQDTGISGGHGKMKTIQCWLSCHGTFEWDDMGCIHAFWRPWLVHRIFQNMIAPMARLRCSNTTCLVLQVGNFHHEGQSLMEIPVSLYLKQVANWHDHRSNRNCLATMVVLLYDEITYCVPCIYIYNMYAACAHTCMNQGASSNGCCRYPRIKNIEIML